MSDIAELSPEAIKAFMSMMRPVLKTILRQTRDMCQKLLDEMADEDDRDGTC